MNVCKNEMKCLCRGEEYEKALPVYCRLVFSLSSFHIGASRRLKDTLLLWRESRWEKLLMMIKEGLHYTGSVYPSGRV